MHGVGAGARRRVNETIDPEVAFGWRVGANRHRFVGHAHVPGGAIAFGVDGHGCDPHIAARTDDPDRDLAAVRDQNLAQNL
jgi:hypothetical protein